MNNAGTEHASEQIYARRGVAHNFFLWLSAIIFLLARAGHLRFRLRRAVALVQPRIPPPSAKLRAASPATNCEPPRNRCLKSRNP